MRYLSRRGVKGWMVWDRNTHSPATINGKPAVKFSEEEAKEHADAMNDVRPLRTRSIEGSVQAKMMTGDHRARVLGKSKP
jgi:hypothetical protein